MNNSVISKRNIQKKIINLSYFIQVNNLTLKNILNKINKKKLCYKLVKLFLLRKKIIATIDYIAFD